MMYKLEFVNVLQEIHEDEGKLEESEDFKVVVKMNMRYKMECVCVRFDDSSNLSGRLGQEKGRFPVCAACIV